MYITIGFTTSFFYLTLNVFQFSQLPIQGQMKNPFYNEFICEKKEIHIVYILTTKNLTIQFQKKKLYDFYNIDVILHTKH